ncbi:MAG: hypothetical protein EBV03_01380 [Proteobacteria bacterium]|nr:hypothetical protein [Pseudomonadota bacterium]
MADTEPQSTMTYSEVGNLLRQAREQLRLPIDQASRLLHIRVRYLESMESGKLDELPGLPYVRGYVQSYAAFLGLDKEEIMRRFDRVASASQSNNIYFPQVLSKEKTPTSPLIWGGLGVALLAYVLWYLVANPSDKRISLVNEFPKPPSGLAQLSPEIIKDVACLNPQEGIYPPCILIDIPEFRVSPLDKQLKSVIEMQLLPLEIPPAKKVEPAEEEQAADEEEEE